MKKILLSLTLISFAIFNSCDKKDTVVAGDSDSVSVASENKIVYQVDLQNSEVEWGGYSITDGNSTEDGHKGIIKLSSGSIDLENHKIVAGEFVIDSKTIESKDITDNPQKKEKLDNHLRDPDFLDVAKYPTATFKITNVASIEGEYNTEISGNLKLREVEKNITFRANVGLDQDKITVASEEFGINRKDFGITFNPLKGSVIKDNVTIKIYLEAEKTTEVAEANLQKVTQPPVNEDVGH